MGFLGKYLVMPRPVKVLAGIALLLYLPVFWLFNPRGVGTYVVGAFLPPINVLPFFHHSPPTLTQSLLSPTNPLEMIQEAARWETERSVIRAAMQAHCGLTTPIGRIRDETYAYVTRRNNRNEHYDPNLYQTRAWLEEDWGTLDNTLWQDFVIHNVDSYPLPDDVIQNARLVSDWRITLETYMTFPSRKCGILTLSRAGFNRNGTQALILVDEDCRGRCGIGVLYLLEKRNGIWVMVKEQMNWIS
jgi:hypothetical protein